MYSLEQAWRNGGDQMDKLMHHNFRLSSENDDSMLTDGETYCDIVTMRIAVNRTYNYYVTSHHMPLWMMGLLPVVTTVLSPDMVGERLDITGAMLMSLIAMQFLIDGNLPPMTDMSITHKMVLCTNIFIMIAILEHAIVEEKIHKEFS